jgi:hypothetical protein
VTVQERQNPPFADAADSGTPETEVIVLDPPAPVFVDSTGRRRRLLRRIAYGFGALCMIYGGLISVSLAGGPISSSAVLPLPGFTGDDEEDHVVVARPTPTPVPTSTRADKQPILEAFPRRAAPVTRRTTEQPGSPQSATSTPQRSATPTARPPRRPAPTATTRPVESDTTAPATPGSTGPTPEATTPPVPPVAPSPPGGSGGGAPAAEDDDGTGPVAAPAVPLPADPPQADPEPKAEPENTTATTPGLEPSGAAV